MARRGNGGQRKEKEDNLLFIGVISTAADVMEGKEAMMLRGRCTAVPTTRPLPQLEQSSALNR